MKDVQKAIEALNEAEAGPGLAVEREKARAEQSAKSMVDLWRVAGTPVTEATLAGIAEGDAERLAIVEKVAQEHLAAQLGDLRNAAYDALAGLEQRAYAAAHKADLAAFSQWPEANARGMFVKEDVNAMHVADIPLSYQVARDAGDDVGAFLLLRYGRARLEALRDSGDIEATILLAELDAAAGPEAGEAELQKALRETEALRLEIERPRGAVEQLDHRTEFAARYGLDVRHVDDLAFAVRR